MTRLSKSMINRICQLFKRGWSRPNVCAKVNIHINSFAAWWKRGTEILENQDYDEVAARKSIRYNRSLTKVDRKMMLLQLMFVCRVQEAVADTYGNLEEVVYNAAMSDDTGKMGIELLQRRRPGTWAKQLPAPVVIATHPIKQIIIHEPHLLEEQNPIEAEYVDV